VSVLVKDILWANSEQKLVNIGDTQMYSRCNAAFGKIHNLQCCASEQCKNVTALGFASWPSLNLAAKLPISLNHDENYC
jgi:hypothetical protein